MKLVEDDILEVLNQLKIQYSTVQLKLRINLILSYELSDDSALS